MIQNQVPAPEGGFGSGRWTIKGFVLFAVPYSIRVPARSDTTLRADPTFFDGVAF